MLGLIQSYLTQKPIYDEPPAVAAPIRETPPPKIEEKPSEMEALFGKLAPDLVIDPPIVLLWKNVEELPFLKKVAEAITKFVETAECREWESKYFDSAKVIVAEAFHLEIKPHVLYENPIRLGMYKTTDYLKNVELKRELWKLLQNIGDLLV